MTVPKNFTESRHFKECSFHARCGIMGFKMPRMKDKKSDEIIINQGLPGYEKIYPFENLNLSHHLSSVQKLGN